MSKVLIRVDEALVIWDLVQEKNERPRKYFAFRVDHPGGKGCRSMYDVKQEQYTTVIREMIRHENDVTNHRIMWLLIGQGFIANAFVISGRETASTDFMLPLVGIMVTLSAFLMLYKSYQARGYLLFLGKQAKQGTLEEEHLPLVGWPGKRIKGWWKDVWICPWIGQPGDLL